MVKTTFQLIVYFVLSFVFSLSLHSQLSLMERSPFIPENFQSSGRSSSAPDQKRSEVFSNLFELRGFYQLGGEYYFNIYNKGSRERRWVALNDELEEYEIGSFSPEEETLNIVLNGETVALALVSPTHSPMPVQTAPASNGKKIEKTTRPARRRIVRPRKNTTRISSGRRRTVSP